MHHTLRLTSFTSTSLLAAANYFADYPGTCLLYSGGSLDSAKQSFLALFPYESVSVKEREIRWQSGREAQHYRFSNPWEGLQEVFFSRLGTQADSYAFGFLGYEMGAFADPDKPLPYLQADYTPDAYWERCALVLVYDHASSSATVILSAFAMPLLQVHERQWMERLSIPEGWQAFRESKAAVDDKQRPAGPLSLRPFLNRKDLYLNQIEQAKEWIRSGDVYQVNLSQSFIFDGIRRPFDVFSQVSQLNPAPFSAYLNRSDFCLVSTSPERFLQKRGNRLETRPIKGTIQRGKSIEEDESLKRQLLASPKERAELLMITDLMRNDLGRVSETGSVETPEIWRCEAYTNVFHLLSLVRSRARNELTSLEIIRACFPGGSITGCPKLRAMEIIQALEKKPRGAYTGSLGYMTGTGDFDLNIAIRTLVFKGKSIYLQLGGGIVIDSSPEQEYLETLFKGESLFKILGNAL
ncbi:aminodeoxychorismate synthase component I [Candidatus Protochlamydia phocaeensis]|uniref:aminodeoxychorismate synthase component I n=1 Tax=Candidatus Protochlamydia phocaeensis TaxID=1414722 RepID=UPI000838C2AB|nr:aminodeoxychorismate synthase component I [Candidatus Protochlamydia phocaeensis]